MAFGSTVKSCSIPSNLYEKIENPPPSGEGEIIAGVSMFASILEYEIYCPSE